MAADTSALAVAQQLLLTSPVTSTQYAVEAVVADTSFVKPRQVDATAVAQQLLMIELPTVKAYSVEAVIEASFQRPPDIAATAIAQQIALVVPQVRTVEDYSVEVVAHGYVAASVDDYAVEVVGGLPYSVQVDDYSVEAVMQSTLSPPTTTQTAFWFTVTEI